MKLLALVTCIIAVMVLVLITPPPPVRNSYYKIIKIFNHHPIFDKKKELFSSMKEEG